MFEALLLSAAVSGVFNTTDTYVIDTLEFTSEMDVETLIEDTFPAFDDSNGTYYGVEFRLVDYFEDGEYLLTSNLEDPHPGYTLDMHAEMRFEVGPYEISDVLFDHWGNDPVNWPCAVDFAAQPGPNLIEFDGECELGSIYWMLGTDVGEFAAFDFDLGTTARYSLRVPGGASLTVGPGNTAEVSGHMQISYIYFPDDQDGDSDVDFDDVLTVLSQWGQYDGHDNQVLTSILGKL